jgi:enterochelin esterase family protein
MSDLLQRARTEGTPIVDGEHVTFVFEGRKPPVLRGDFNDWSTDQAPSWRRRRGGFWTANMSFPEDAYIEYVFGPDEARLFDPYNPRLVSNGVGQFNNYFHMPSAVPTLLVHRRRGLPQGRVTRHLVPAEEWAVGRERAVYLYAPPVSTPVPLVVVYDGPDYLRRARLPVILDNLIAQQRIRPIALAMVANGGRARSVEYACNDSTLMFLLEAILPLASQELNLLDPATHLGAYGVLGASMGGLMALFTGLRLPDLFGRVLSQSGAFHFEDYETVPGTLVRHRISPGLRIWMDVGRYEWLLDSNRRMASLLEENGYAVTYQEANAGHNYTSWRNTVGRGLETLFPAIA